MQFYKGTATGVFKYYTDSVSINDSMSGLWNCIIATDINNDGKTDYILGNEGRNIRYETSQAKPFYMFYNDFDDNGYKEIITAYNEKGKYYPTKQLKLLTQRINGLSKKYYRLADYAKSDIYQVFGKAKIDSGKVFKIDQVNSMALINQGNGNFKVQYLPVEAQFGPVNAITELPVGTHACKEYLLAGNNEHPEIEAGKYDALKQTHLTADCTGNLTVDKNLIVSGDMRKPVIIKIKGKAYIVYPINNHKPVWLGMKE